MLATRDIESVWEKFDSFPMETLTKAWYYRRTSGSKQRDISLMKEHHEQYGITGNCFDLAIWLLHEFGQQGIEAYPIGHHLGTPHAHVAVIAKNANGKRYLCDLGDQWLKPILVDADSEDFTSDRLAVFFPAADVQVTSQKDVLLISYHRPNGRISRQEFSLEPLDRSTFMGAAEISQNTLKKPPLLECRVPYKTEIAHWEFYNGSSFMSTTEGIINEPETGDKEVWRERIRQKTGYSKEFLLESIL
ncbi:hypothetical protein [Paenibacillus sp. FJAT-26967]|uniref:hypothetical protein n=1 Tax=Paenibacillus sp. FJAT-26967 TaxID=1729690 RepID=UPI00083917E4|nr:hypothetical protein [Paenibacillus sp. FJAT-26967]